MAGTMAYVHLRCCEAAGRGPTVSASGGHAPTIAGATDVACGADAIARGQYE
ncbi:MAG TPA: hypothetical protein VK802_09670 [Streptosporangiaceae bacterium]|nr:hypothetical protein [Streptosporangiaceae bacterium]